MAVQASKLISVTNKKTGAAIKLSANQIVKFTLSGSVNTLMSYINQEGRFVNQIFVETVAAINTAATRTQAVTLTKTGQVYYINSDKIILMDTTAAGTNITMWNGGGKNHVSVMKVNEAVAAINTAAGNTFSVTCSSFMGARSGQVNYINNLFIGQVTPKGSGSEILFDTKKVEWQPLYVTQTPAAIQTAVNAL
jgi:DNA gyrase/topoisomerase IV subunit A